MPNHDTPISRRTLLCRGAQTAALALAAARLEPLLAAPGSRWFKIGACEWNLQKADPTSFDVAKQIGLDGVQINMGSTGDDMHLRKPEVQKAYLEYRDKGVQFLCVLGGSKDDEIKEFREDHKVTFPLAKDNGIAEFLEVRAIPQTFFFSKGGKFEKRIMGPATYRELTANIEKIMDK